MLLRRKYYYISNMKHIVGNLLTDILLAFTSISLSLNIFLIASVRTRFNKHITFHMILIYAIITCFQNKSRHRVRRLIAYYQKMLLCEFHHPWDVRIGKLTFIISTYYNNLEIIESEKHHHLLNRKLTSPLITSFLLRMFAMD